MEKGDFFSFVFFLMVVPSNRASESELEDDELGEGRVGNQAMPLPFPSFLKLAVARRTERIQAHIRGGRQNR